MIRCRPLARLSRTSSLELRLTGSESFPRRPSDAAPDRLGYAGERGGAGEPEGTRGLAARSRFEDHVCRRSLCRKWRTTREPPYRHNRGNDGRADPIVTVRLGSGRSQQFNLQDLVRRGVEPGANPDVIMEGTIAANLELSACAGDVRANRSGPDRCRQPRGSDAGACA